MESSKHSPIDKSAVVTCGFGFGCEGSAARERMQALLRGCGEICDTNMQGQPSLFFPEIKKRLNCSAIMTNAAIDESRPFGTPPRVPDVMLSAFTYDGRISIVPYGESLLNQQYLDGMAETPDWLNSTIEQWKSQCTKGTLNGNYGRGETKNVLEGLQRMPSVKGGHVLVIGSENPWLEACVLAAGASFVTTLEYGNITSYHPQVKAITPVRMRELYISGKLPLFDAVATFSSVEHSGLGRYGDALNPWGDLQAIARAWCVTKPKGGLLLGVLMANDGTDGRIEFNAHRVYGPLMFTHLTANWKQVWRSAANEGHKVNVLVRMGSF